MASKIYPLAAALSSCLLLVGCPNEFFPPIDCGCAPTPESRVKGVVTDAATGQPLAGVTVASDNDTTLSDADGEYSVRLGSTVAAIKRGYHSQIGDTSLFPQNTTSTYDFTLTSGDPTDVTAPPAPLPSAVIAKSFLNSVLQWNMTETVADLAGFVIYRGNETIGMTAYQQLDSESISDKAQCYSIAAIDASGNESPRSGEMCWVSTSPGTAITYRIIPDVEAVSSSEIRLGLLVPSDLRNVPVTFYRDGMALTTLTPGEDLIINYFDGSLSANSRYCYSVTIASDGVPGWDEMCITTWP